MKAKKNYSDEIKSSVIADYKEGVVGYKRLAKKYKITRDLVRSWILSWPLRKRLQANNNEAFSKKQN